MKVGLKYNFYTIFCYKTINIYYNVLNIYWCIISTMNIFRTRSRSISRSNITLSLSLLLINLPIYNTFCESKLKNDTIMIDNKEIPVELGNSISSLAYSAFGICGLFIKNHSFNYYVLMNIFILMGISSTIHHYYFTTNSWAYLADIACVELIISYSLIFLVNTNKFGYIVFKNASPIKYKNLQNFIIFIILSNYLTMVIANCKNIILRNLFIKINMGFIITNQLYSCVYIYNYHNKYFKTIIKYNLFNGIYFSLSIFFWFLDNLCYPEIFFILNSHALWHVFSAHALFNTINTSIIHNCIDNNLEFDLKPLIKKLPYFLFIVKKYNRKSNIKNSSTNVNLEDVRIINNRSMSNNFIDNYNFIHRRIRSYG